MSRERHRRLSELFAEAGRLAPEDRVEPGLRLDLQSALAGLPALERDAFLLREVGGLGYAEIAKACEISPDSVRSRIYRARLALRSTLGAGKTGRTFQIREIRR